MRFDRIGLVFDYPDDWTLELDADGGSEAGGSPTVTLLSPGGGFWSVSRHDGYGNARLLAEAVVAQMRSEYQDIDVAAASDTIGQTWPRRSGGRSPTWPRRSGGR